MKKGKKSSNKGVREKVYSEEILQSRRNSEIFDI